MSEVNVKERKVREGLQGGKGHDAWQVDVFVYLHSPEPGHFTVESYLQSDPENTEKLVFNNRYHPGFDVTFNLVDETGLNYRFPTPDDRENGIWSLMGTTCPSETDHGWEVFEKNSIHVFGDGMALKAHNPNAGDAVGDFKYTLNVGVEGRKPYLPLDPGGTNNNGMTSRNDL
jgi:hypothetical protein